MYICIYSLYELGAKPQWIRMRRHRIALQLLNKVSIDDAVSFQHLMMANKIHKMHKNVRLANIIGSTPSTTTDFPNANVIWSFYTPSTSGTSSH